MMAVGSAMMFFVCCVVGGSPGESSMVQPGTEDQLLTNKVGIVTVRSCLPKA